MGNKHGLPNSFQHPNFYVDQLDQYLTSEESRVLTKAIREILGWHNTIGSRTARIALSVFLEGKFDTKTGKQLCGGVNLSRKAIIAALDTLHKYKILQKVGPKTHPNGQAYKLNINTDCIDEDGLKQRRQRMKTRNTKQTRYARQTKQNHQAQVVEQHELTARVVEQPELKKARVVQQHEYSGCSTTRARQKARVVEQTEGNKIRRKKKKEKEREEKKNPSLALFSQFFPDVELNSIQQETIQSTIQDLSKWKATCTRFALQNYRADKIENLLDYYLNHAGGNGNGSGSVESLTWLLSLPKPEQEQIEQRITAQFAVVLEPLSLEKRRKHQTFQQALTGEYEERQKVC